VLTGLEAEHKPFSITANKADIAVAIYFFCTFHAVCPEAVRQ
jgi:hypothetical protein